MALIIFLGIYLGSVLFINWVFINGYKAEIGKDKVTIQEYCKENEWHIALSFIPVINTIMLIVGIIGLIVYSLWELIRDIKI